MAWDNILHKRLRDICAYLWEDSRDCRRLVADSLIDSTRINWDEPPTLRWQSVIMECEKQGTLHKLVPVLLAEYPENTHLREAVAPWMANISGGAEATGMNETTTVTKPTQSLPTVKVPVKVPVEFVETVDELPITLDSMRADMAFMSKKITELERWRKEVAILAAKDRVGEAEQVSPVEVSLPSKKKES